MRSSHEFRRHSQGLHTPDRWATCVCVRKSSLNTNADKIRPPSGVRLARPRGACWSGAHIRLVIKRQATRSLDASLVVFSSTTSIHLEQNVPIHREHAAKSRLSAPICSLTCAEGLLLSEIPQPERLEIIIGSKWFYNVTSPLLTKSY